MYTVLAFMHGNIYTTTTTNDFIEIDLVIRIQNNCNRIHKTTTSQQMNNYS